MARFLYIYPVDLAGHRLIDTPDIPPTLLAGYHKFVQQIALHQPLTNEYGGTEPHPILLTAEARQLRNDFDQEIENRYATGGDLAGLREWAGKLVGNTVRVAGLLHLMHFAEVPNPWDHLLEGATMADAIQIGRYAIEHSRMAHNEMRADGNTAGATKLMSWFREKAVARFSPRDILRGLNCFKSNADLVGPLSLLSDHACIRPLHGGRGEAYEVNPALFQGEDTALPVAPPAPTLAGNYSEPVNLMSTEKETPVLQTSEDDMEPFDGSAWAWDDEDVQAQGKDPVSWPQQSMTDF